MNNLNLPTSISRMPSELPTGGPTLPKQPSHSASVSPSTSTSPDSKLSLSPSKSSLVGQDRLSRVPTESSTSTRKSLSFLPIQPKRTVSTAKVTHKISTGCVFSPSSKISTPPSLFTIQFEQSHAPHSTLLSTTDLFFEEIFYGRSDSSSTLDLPAPTTSPIAPTHASSVSTSSFSRDPILITNPEIAALNKQLSELDRTLKENPKSTASTTKLTNILKEYLKLDPRDSLKIDHQLIALTLDELVYNILNPAECDLGVSRSSQIAAAKATVERLEKMIFPLTYTIFLKDLRLNLESIFRLHFASMLNIPSESLYDFGLITFEDFETIGLYQVPLFETQFDEQVQLLRNLVEKIQKPLFHSDFDPLSKTCPSHSKRQLDRVHTLFNHSRCTKTMRISGAVNYYLSTSTFENPENLERAKYTLARHYLDQNCHIARKIHQLHKSASLSELLRASSQFFMADIFAFHNLHILLAGDRRLTPAPVSLPPFDEQLFEFYEELLQSPPGNQLDERYPRVKRQRRD